jgi:hypothetical protein
MGLMPWTRWSSRVWSLLPANGALRRQSQAWVYGRIRRFRYKQLRCRWAVSGLQVPVHVFVIEMAGSEKPWWLKPEWHPRKYHASILDLRRLFWRYRAEFAQFILALEKWEKISEPPGQCRYPAGRVA